MILYPPVKFDTNEWFVIISGAVLLTAVFLLPKRFSALTVFMIWLFNFFLAQATDFVLGKPPLNLYYNNDLIEYEYFDVLLYLVVFPPFAYVFDYFYDKWRLKGIRLCLYILSWAAFTTTLEHIAERYFHPFPFTGWKSWYSFFAYIIIYVLILWAFRIVSKKYEERP